MKGLRMIKNLPLLFSLCTLVSCSNVGGPTFDILWRAPEDKGSRVTLSGGVYPEKGVFWSNDGNELYFVRIKDGGGMLQSLSLSTSFERTICTIQGFFTPPLLSRDGSTFYYTASTLGRNDQPSQSLFKVSTNGQGLTKIDDLQTVVGYTWFRPFAVSADNNLIAYSVGSSMYLYSNASRTRRFLTIGNPISFSPDGSQLWYYLWDNTLGAQTFAMYAVTLSDGSIRRVPIDLTNAVGFARWDVSGMKVVESAADCSTVLRDCESGIATVIWKSPHCDHSHQVNAEWQGVFNDAQKTCTTDERGIFLVKTVKYIPCNCSAAKMTLQFFLRSITMVPAKETVIAFMDDDVGSVSVSPDRKKVAYIISGIDLNVYVKNMP